ncbi:hypothetical protein POM88_033666 [Heracleum sosnowskyi]|uniref:F-box domain-containing protein n=1 Tax=Heracleum sosnowskyi TaxID=360622 RepID=A0AAD8HJS1_9APIA|nr:hypothetical protein POM88_033666 [Heracleum sosnowskyi]
MDEVLCRVPVKYLLRCRCVSKTWCSFIDSTPFLKKHLKKTLECNAGGVFISGGGKFFLSEFESLDDDSAAVVELKDPGLNNLLSGAEFVGAANGLVCLSKNDMNEIILLNPSTRKARKIRSAPAEFPRSFNMIETSLCGFGYDHVNDDFKVVKIAECYLQFRGIMTVVYSLKTDSWTRIRAVPSNIRFTGIGFHEVPFPTVNGAFVNFNRRSVVSFGGSYLCILDNYPNSRIDGWLMNDNGAENLWYKAFSVEQPGALGSFKFLRPVVFSKSCKEVLLEVDGAKLVWYDLERKTVKTINIHGMPIKFNSHLYTESLIRLAKNKEPQKPSQDKQQKEQKRDDFLAKGFKLRL